MRTFQCIMDTIARESLAQCVDTVILQLTFGDIEQPYKNKHWNISLRQKQYEDEMKELETAWEATGIVNLASPTLDETLLPFRRAVLRTFSVSDMAAVSVDPSVITLVSRSVHS